MKTLIDTFKALGNEHRLQMLVWLHNPALHFPEFVAEDPALQQGGWIAWAKSLKKRAWRNRWCRAI